MPVLSAAHPMVRLDIPTGMSFDAFTAAFEAAAPAFDRDAALRAGRSTGGWDDFRAAVAANAPNELMIFAKIDVTPLMALAGHRTRSTEYLLGNPVVAERMFRHHPASMLYAPLRILVHSDDTDRAVFTLDQPSVAFGSFGISEVTEVGVALDRKVANLLRLIGVDPPEALTGPTG